MVIASHVDHQRFALDVGQFQPWCQHRCGSHAVSIDIERWQIALVIVICPGITVLAAAIRVEVTSGRTAQYRLAVFAAGVATAILMHMEAVNAGCELLKIGG